MALEIVTSESSLPTKKGFLWFAHLKTYPYHQFPGQWPLRAPVYLLPWNSSRLKRADVVRIFRDLHVEEEASIGWFMVILRVRGLMISMKCLRTNLITVASLTLSHMKISEVMRTPRFHGGWQAHLCHITRFQRGQGHTLHQLLRLRRVLAANPQGALGVGALLWHVDQLPAGAHGRSHVSIWADGWLEGVAYVDLF